MTQHARSGKHSSSENLQRRVRGSRTGRPIMSLLDLLGRRMTLRILWELSIAEQPLKFRELQSAADTNPAVLNTRLKDLREADMVTHDDDGYRLTEIGQSLSAHVLPLHKWAETWAGRARLMQE